MLLIRHPSCTYAALTLRLWDWPRSVVIFPLESSSIALLHCRTWERPFIYGAQLSRQVEWWRRISGFYASRVVWSLPHSFLLEVGKMCSTKGFSLYLVATGPSFCSRRFLFSFWLTTYHSNDFYSTMASFGRHTLVPGSAF